MIIQYKYLQIGMIPLVDFCKKYNLDKSNTNKRIKDFKHMETIRNITIVDETKLCEFLQIPNKGV